MKFSKSLIECMGVCFPIAVLDFQQSQSCHCYSSLAFTNQVGLLYHAFSQIILDYYSTSTMRRGKRLKVSVSWSRESQVRRISG